MIESGAYQLHHFKRYSLAIVELSRFTQQFSATQFSAAQFSTAQRLDDSVLFTVLAVVIRGIVVRRGDVA